MKLRNPMNLYMASMGKLFLVTKVCQSQDDANKYCEEHPESGVIDEDDDGNIYIAELEPHDVFLSETPPPKEDGALTLDMDKVIL